MSNPDEPRETEEPAKLKDVFTHLSPDSATASEGTVQKLFTALSAHFEPKDILEEIWLHDIARITSSIEVFRLVERSVQYSSMKNRLDNFVRTGAIHASRGEAANKGIYNLTIGGPGASKLPDAAILKVAGALSEIDIRKAAAIADVIQKLQRERDRIYAQFERKRRPLVVASVKTVEAQVSAPNPTDKLAE